MKDSQKGRSMIEMIAVLAIIGIITVGAIAGVNQGFVKYRTSKTFTEIKAINQGVDGMFKYLRSYPGSFADYMEDACESKVFPSGCEPGNEVAANPFGGAYAVDFTNDNKMIITAGDIPQDACQELMELDWGLSVRKNGDNPPSCSPNDADLQTFRITFD